MKYSDKNKPIVCMMTQSTCYRQTRKMEVKGVLWHSTGANNPNLKRYVQPSDNDVNKDKLLEMLGKNNNGNDWNHIEHKAGLNCWIGKLANGTVTTIQTMPWDYRPWGCGSGKKGSCNDGFVQFEICEDSLNDRVYFDKVYKEACELTAYICKMYNIDPNGTVLMNGINVPTILDHAESCKLGFGSNHGDVQHWFSKYGKSMQTVRKDVAALMGALLPSPTPPVSMSSTFKKGDVVKIKSGAKYDNGRIVPSWVQKKDWVIKEVSGDRVVIDKSADGKNAICSAINAQYLTAVGSKEAIKPYLVRTTEHPINITKEPNGDSKVVKTITNKGVYTIIDESNGYGLLKAYQKNKDGWIDLKYTRKI